MRTPLFVIASILPTLLVGCSDPKDATEANFTTAMNQYLSLRGSECLNIKNWPVDITNDRDIQAKRMATLESIGLVKQEEVDVEVKNFFDFDNPIKQVKAKRYTLTDNATSFIRKEIPPQSLFVTHPKEQTRLCWGQKSLDKIEKWEGPIELGDYKEVSVVYTYNLDVIAEWATKNDVQASFPEINQAISRSKEKVKHILKLTSEGWEAKGLE